MNERVVTVAREEARRELRSLLGGKALEPIPSEWIVEHLLNGYPDAEWPVLREAGRALLRRAASGDKEGLKVAERPDNGTWRGLYRTRRPRKKARPYATRLFELHPLRVSCDCPDYLRGSLGLCKHGLTVLRDLASRPRVLERARAEAGATQDPVALWYPIRPLDGAGDWLERVLLRADLELPKALNRAFVPGSEGWFEPAFGELPDARRGKIVEALDTLLSRRRNVDPALRALLRYEREETKRRAELRLTAARRERALRSFALRLYPYQLESVKKCLATGRMLLADDMGLGKTIQAAAIGHVLSRAGKIRRVLVLAPASLKSQWVREWRRATDVPIEGIEGTPDARRQLYERTKEGVLVGNYEQVFRDLELMQQWKPDLVILDEAQRIKNWATRTAQRVKQLDAPYRLVLTGTPMENRLDELASIMDWVDPFTVAPKWRLGPAHNVLADGKREVVGVRRLDVLRKRLAPRMLRRRRKEILEDLPARTDTMRPVVMTEAQLTHHEELNQPIAVLLRTAQRRGLTQAQFLRLMSLLTTQRIIANGLAQLQFAEIWPGLRNRPPDEATRASLAMPKLEHLRDLVESIVIDQERKVVVFSQWRRALSLAHWSMRDLLDRAGVRAAFFTGQESQQRRTQNVIDFHDDPSLRILFCSDAGGVGLNLQRAASCCINFELPWNPAVLEQRIARIHRLGQPEPVDVYTLASDGSIEARIAAAVTNKRAMFDGLFDGDTEEVRFEGSAGFLKTIEKLVDAPSISAEDADADAADPDDLDPTDDPHVDEVISAGDERGDAPPSPKPEAPVARPRAEDVRAMFSELRVEPKPDGSVHMEASPDAARTLGALFSGMATLLEQASLPETRHPRENER